MSSTKMSVASFSGRILACVPLPSAQRAVRHAPCRAVLATARARRTTSETPAAAAAAAALAADAAKTARALLALGPAALGALLAEAAAAPGAAAAAAEAVAYNNGAGSEALKTAAGVGYIAAVAVYFAFLFKRRVAKFTSVRISTMGAEPAAEAAEDSEDEAAAAAATAAAADVSPLQALVGAAQAGAVAVVLWNAAGAVDAFFAAKELPTQYTARNIAVLVETVARGLVYLCTFIFSANATGLALLGAALAFAPQWVDAERAPRKPASTLPRVALSDDVRAVRRAFRQADEQGKLEAARAAKRAAAAEAERGGGGGP
jgi:hypothetical protein